MSGKLSQGVDYLRILKKFDERKLNTNVDFFKSLPLFSQWTRQSVTKLALSFKEVEFTRNSFVFREGEHPNYVYFVKKGDFNLLKNFPAPSTDFQGRKAKKQRVHLAILGVGEMFGNDEVLKDIEQQCSCQCASSSGVLLCIEKQDFIKKIAFADNLQTVTQQTDLRQEEHLRRLKEIEEIKRFSLATNGLSHVRLRHEAHDGHRSHFLATRTLSRIDPAYKDLSPKVEAGFISFDGKLDKGPTRTMTNLTKLPDLPYQLKKRTETSSPHKALKRSFVKNIHMQAVRDKHMRYYIKKPYMLFAKQEGFETSERLISVSALDNIDDVSPK